MPTDPYNPLDKINLGKSVAEALLDSPVQSLDNLPMFGGAGVYVIYYTGGHPAYARLGEWNRNSVDWPIYIGKAVPSGARTGIRTKSKEEEKNLRDRLMQHRVSIKSAPSLKVTDFACRYLTVDDIWIPLGETVLINKFKPVWNVVLPGFGNHHTGGGRYEGEVPLWDVLHPGRGWAARLKPRTETPDELTERVRTFLAENPPDDPHMIFRPEH